MLGRRYRGVVVTEAGSCLRPIDSCITQLRAQGPSRTCNESAEEEVDPHPIFVEGKGPGLTELHLQTLITHKPGFNQNYYTFTSTILIKIVL